MDDILKSLDTTDAVNLTDEFIYEILDFYEPLILCDFELISPHGCYMDKFDNFVIIGRDFYFRWNGCYEVSYLYSLIKISEDEYLFCEKEKSEPFKLKRKKI